MHADDELTFIIGEAHAEVGLLDLFHENIFLIEKKNNGSDGKVSVIANAVEEVQALMHAILKQETDAQGPFCSFYSVQLHFSS